MTLRPHAAEHTLSAELSYLQVPCYLKAGDMRCLHCHNILTHQLTKFGWQSSKATWTATFEYMLLPRHWSQQTPADIPKMTIARKWNARFCLLACNHPRVGKYSSVEFSRHPDLIHGIAAAPALRTQAVGLKHGAPHKDHLAGLHFAWGAIAGAAPLKLGDRPCPCTLICCYLTACWLLTANLHWLHDCIAHRAEECKAALPIIWYTVYNSSKHVC